MLIGLEKSFDCAGFCTKGKYFIKKDLDEGPPEKDCIRGMVNGLAGRVGAAAYVTIVTGLLLIVGMIGGFPLCTGFEKAKDEP